MKQTQNDEGLFPTSEVYFLNTLLLIRSIVRLHYKNPRLEFYDNSFNIYLYLKQLFSYI